MSSSLAQRLEVAETRALGLSPEKVQARVSTLLLEQLEAHAGFTEAELADRAVGALQVALAEKQFSLTSAERASLVQKTLDEVLGLGAIERLLQDTTVSEIMVSRFDLIFVERNGMLEQTQQRFESEAALRKTIDRLVTRVGRRIDEASPMVDARMPDGSRLNAVIPPIALDGSALTIRKFASEGFTADDLVLGETITQSALDLLRAEVSRGANIVVSGSTGSGKTTTLNVLSSFIGEAERVVTIEDSAELSLKQLHLIRLESRPKNTEGQGEVTVRDLVKNALRMRPDRIVVGEVRDAAAFDMLQAMSTGHSGSLTTVHANSAVDALSRIETLALMAENPLPALVVREQVARAVDLVVHQVRLASGARRVTQILEVGEFTDNRIQTRELLDASGEVK